MSHFVPPVIRDENGDISFYPDLATAELDTETYDVIAGEYDFFDATGRRLIPRVQGQRVRLEFDPNARPETEDLRLRLARLATRIGPQRIGLERPEEQPLNVLVSAFWRRYS